MLLVRNAIKMDDSVQFSERARLLGEQRVCGLPVHSAEEAAHLRRRDDGALPLGAAPRQQRLGVGLAGPHHHAHLKIDVNTLNQRKASSTVSDSFISVSLYVVRVVAFLHCVRLQIGNE